MDEKNVLSSDEFSLLANGAIRNKHHEVLKATFSIL